MPGAIGFQQIWVSPMPLLNSIKMQMICHVSYLRIKYLGVGTILEFFLSKPPVSDFITRNRLYPESSRDNTIQFGKELVKDLLHSQDSNSRHLVKRRRAFVTHPSTTWFGTISELETGMYRLLCLLFAVNNDVGSYYMWDFFICIDSRVNMRGLEVGAFTKTQDLDIQSSKFIFV